ncbi:MAG TPA: S53 family peptidase [Pseudolabrys sp.]|nr:S53 family peptidase [Pseudolabrys sp.]
MQNRHALAAIAAGIAALTFSGPGFAADHSDLVSYGALRAKPIEVIPHVGTIVIPESSIEHAGDIGLRAHTHSRVLIPAQPVEPPEAGTVSNSTSPLLTTTETPASLACVYRLVAQTYGCNPTKVSKVAAGGSKAIAIVDAYHNKTALNDLKTFSTHFKLPAPNLTVVYCSSTTCTGVTKPPPACQTSDQCGWALEIALDLDAAHAMAPHAKLYLVEANSNSYVDLMRAEDRAAQLVAAAGGGQVTNSWGGSDFKQETSYDSHFVKNKVVFFASTGDHKCSGAPTCPDVEYPSVSPNVVGVGGTTINRTNAKAFSSESAWIYGGGGLSKYEKRPSYQNKVQNRVGAHRGAPDVSADADPASGMWVRCSTAACGGSSAWYIVGGTSLASPLIAGITNNAGHFRASSAAELTTIYNELGGARFNDITSGKCGNGTNGALVPAITGWDRCTGVGTPKGKAGL